MFDVICIGTSKAMDFKKFVRLVCQSHILNFQIQLESATELLKDAFRCLLSDEIKLTCLKKQPATADDADMMGTQEAQANAEAQVSKRLEFMMRQEMTCARSQPLLVR